MSELRDLKKNKTKHANKHYLKKASSPLSFFFPSLSRADLPRLSLRLFLPLTSTRAPYRFQEEEEKTTFHSRFLFSPPCQTSSYLSCLFFLLFCFVLFCVCVCVFTYCAQKDAATRPSPTRNQASNTHGESKITQPNCAAPDIDDSRKMARLLTIVACARTALLSLPPSLPLSLKPSKTGERASPRQKGARKKKRSPPWSKLLVLQTRNVMYPLSTIPPSISPTNPRTQSRSPPHYPRQPPVPRSEHPHHAALLQHLVGELLLRPHEGVLRREEEHAVALLPLAHRDAGAVPVR